MGVVLRRYIDFLILLIRTPLVSVLFGSSIPTFLFIIVGAWSMAVTLWQRFEYYYYYYYFKMFFVLVPVLF